MLSFERNIDKASSFLAVTGVDQAHDGRMGQWQSVGERGGGVNCWNTPIKYPVMGYVFADTSGLGYA